MPHTINTEDLAIPVSQVLLTLINKCLNSKPLNRHTDALAINFRDTSYSAETGGYHTVKIGLMNSRKGWEIEYITDFSFSGGPYPELVKEVDFLFSHRTLHFSYAPPLPLTHSDSKEFYQMWESNFLSYVDMDCFDEIQVTHHN